MGSAGGAQPKPMGRQLAQMVAIPTSSTTITTSNQQQLDAVIIRDLTYEVGRRSSRKVILNGINLTVPEGSM